MLVVHHADHDGRFGAHIIGRFFKKNGGARYLETNYGKHSVEDILREAHGEAIVMVDFSMPPEDMVRLWTETDMLWIDHHISAIRDIQAAERKMTKEELSKVRRVVDPASSGCLLAWKVTHPDPDVEIPEGVRILQEWDHGSMERIPRLTSYGLESMDTSPGSAAWDLALTEDGLKGIQEEGKPVVRYVDKQLKEWFREYSYITTLEAGKDTYQVLVLNAPVKHDAFVVVDSVVLDAVDLKAVARRKPDGWSISIYSDSPGIDCSVIAKTFGGGGHKGAAGFRSKEYPFAPMKEKESENA